MATFIKGDAIILYVHDGTAYLPIACLTSNSLAQTRNIIEAQTKCDPAVIIKQGGSSTYDVSYEGNYIDTTSATGDNTKASHDALFELFNTNVNVTWKMDTGLTDKPNYFGTGVLGDLEMTAPAGDEFVTFSGTLSGSGAIVEIDPIP